MTTDDLNARLERIERKLDNLQPKFRANFLYPSFSGSLGEAGYEFVNAKTERYRKFWWRKLIARARNGYSKLK